MSSERINDFRKNKKQNKANIKSARNNRMQTLYSDESFPLGYLDDVIHSQKEEQPKEKEIVKKEVLPVNNDKDEDEDEYPEYDNSYFEPQVFTTKKK